MTDYALAVERLYGVVNFGSAETYEDLQRTWRDARPIPTRAQLDQAWLTIGAEQVAAAVKDNADSLALSDIRQRWQNSPLHNKTPSQIFTAMQSAIDGWPNLAAAKADLRQWLPLLAAALAWTTFKDYQRD